MPNLKIRGLIILAVILLLLAGTLTYFQFFRVQTGIVKISEVDHEVLFSGVTPPSPSDNFFSATSYSSGFSLNLGQTFNDTISFYSVTSLRNYYVINISLQSPVSSTFSIESMNSTLPVGISSNRTSATIVFTIKAPDSSFDGPLTVEITIGSRP